MLLVQISRSPEPLFLKNLKRARRLTQFVDGQRLQSKRWEREF
jgi:hypothetical protein